MWQKHNIMPSLNSLGFMCDGGFLSDHTLRMNANYGVGKGHQAFLLEVKL